MDPSPALIRGHRISAWLFLRLLALAYLAAFAGFLAQAQGLVGPRGILPLAQTLHAVAAQYGAARFWALPTLSWINPLDPPLQSLAGAGVLLSLALFFGIAPLPCLAGLWLLYLSLVSDGQDFMGFQWDGLLLEAGLLALLLAPWRLRSSLARDPEPPRPARWALLWLLFRLMFSSGVVKLASGDAHWRDLSALDYHFWTQPLPLWTSWYASRMPGWFLHLSCLGVFAVELALPPLICHRRARKPVFWGFSGLMVLIAATGNYCFFNLLALALCVLLLEDQDWPAWLAARLKPQDLGSAGPKPIDAAGPQRVALGAGLLLVVLSVPPFAEQLGLPMNWPAWIRVPEAAVAPLRSVNAYGLFAVMTTTRPEIILEGSEDGDVWKEYGFRFKPGDPSLRPGLAAPYQPRLDWQLWFAAMGPVQDSPWFGQLCYHLLRGTPEVLDLMGSNPFPQKPPRYLRAQLYEYRFSDPKTLDTQGLWWQRHLKGEFCPVMSLRNPQ